MPAADNAVVQALRSFPANGVYFLASKKDVVQGFRHHEEQRVESYSWNKDFSVLEADLRVDGLNAVSFFVEQGKLSFGCDCHAWKAGISLCARHRRAADHNQFVVSTPVPEAPGRFAVFGHLETYACRRQRLHHRHLFLNRQISCLTTGRFAQCPDGRKVAAPSVAPGAKG